MDKKERSVEKEGLKFNLVTYKDIDEGNWYFTRLTIYDESGNYVVYDDSLTTGTSYIASAKIGNQKLYRNHYGELVKSGKGRISKNTFDVLANLLKRIDNLYGDRTFDGFGNIGSIQTGVVLTYGYCGVKH